MGAEALIYFSLRGSDSVRGYAARFRVEVNEFVGTLAKLASGKAAELTPFKTGELRRSIGYSAAEPLAYEVSASAPHAAAVEFGRGPVEASRARALRFELEGRVLFRRRVGPARERPFLRPALEWARGQVQATAARILLSREGAR